MRPMLACDIDPEEIHFPILAQPKIDGVRALDLGKGLVGRSLRQFNNKLLHNIHLPGLDGELIVGTDPKKDSLCRDTTSAINTIDTSEQEIVFTLFVFDYVNPINWNNTYADRMYEFYSQDLMEEYLAKLKAKGIPLNLGRVETKRMDNLQELLDYERKALALGYEGIIIRQPNSVYHFGRVSKVGQNCCRIKRFADAEAKVIGLVQGMRNTNLPTTNALGLTERSTYACGMEPSGMVGSLICIDLKTGMELTISPGKLTHAERKHYWENQNELMGQVIKYKYFPRGIKDLPRSPTFQSIRSKEDM